MTKFIKDNWLIIVAELLILTAFCIFYGSFGDVFVDSFREAYIPEQIVNGKVLYKNIFCIYPPLSYLINAFLFKIFGVKLGVIYLAGLFATMCSLFFFNKICKMFFENYLTLGINLFLISGLVLSPNVFNSFFPYSYGMLYGLMFALMSVYFALNKKYPPAYLLCSLALCSKTEFLPLVFALMYLSRKEAVGKNTLMFILPPVIIFAVLLIQGAKFGDFATSAALIKIMSRTETLKEFYWSMGLVPAFEHIKLYIFNFINFLIPLKPTDFQTVLIWAFPVISGIFFFRFKHLTQNEKFFISASLLISLKVFFGLTIQSYGAFYLCFALISLMILLGKNVKKVFAAYLIIWACIAGFYNSKTLMNKNFVISNDKGTVKVLPKAGKEISETIDFVNTLSKDATVVIYPEELVVNYFTGRNSDSKFYSLIPLYVETFGEENIIKRLELTKPDYIIISDYNTFAYGFSEFGKNYALNIVNYLDKNYKKINSNIPNIVIYKK